MPPEPTSPPAPETGVRPAARYRIDPGPSRFTVQAFAGGLLSFVAHSPTFAVRDFQGELRWQPESSAEAGLDLAVRATSLDLLDQVRPADRADIEGRLRRDVLAVDAYPDIRYRADAIVTLAAAPPRYRLRLAGELTLRGIRRAHPLEADLEQYSDGVRLAGETALLLSDHGVPPVTALGGAIRLQDRLRLTFDLAAWKEAS